MIRTSKDEVINARKRWYRSPKDRAIDKRTKEEKEALKEARKKLEDIAIAKEFECYVDDLI